MIWRSIPTLTVLFCALFVQKMANALVLPHQCTSSLRPQENHATALMQASTDVDSKPLWAMEDLEDYADNTGVVISFTTMGPGYRAVARAKHDESLVLGYVEGFVRPSGQILHLDKMEIFKPQLEKARRQKPDAFDFGGISFGLGLMMGYRCLLHANEKGCSIAEFLAIDDEEFQHKRLVRYYRRVGFKVVKYVGEALQDVPDRLIWGGCGTLMKEDIPVLQKKWADLLSLMKERSRVST